MDRCTHDNSCMLPECEDCSGIRFFKGIVLVVAFYGVLILGILFTVGIIHFW